MNPYNYCSTCDYCVRGQPQFCVNEAMKTALGYLKDGGWQQFIIVPGQLCFVLPPSMSLRQSVFCQPLSTVLRGWDNMGNIFLDSKILVAGAGEYFFVIRLSHLRVRTSWSRFKLTGVFV